jgi:3-dehydroquinate dehydratase/shikimate dehydrogenase
MGEPGVPSRLLAARFGSKWTYGGRAVAPGQMPAAQMVDEFRFRQIRASTALYGVVGGNALRSLSPVMHNAAFSAAGIDAVYVPLRPADFDDFLRFAGAMQLSGASVTIPYKLDALGCASRADELTRAVGAANTLRRRGSYWDATNTDVDGFLEPLESAFGGSLRGARVAILGAGGAARAVIVALMSRGAVVSVHARRLEQAHAVAGALGASAGAWPPPSGSWDVLVNSTPMRQASPLPDGPFDGRLVYDLTYGLDESALLRDAAAAGCRVVDGLPMLIAQAERQFAWWTGQRPAAGVMRAAAERRIAGAQVPAAQR